MPVIPILNLLKLPLLWRYVGFMSSVIGLLCYALSSSFKHLFGEWNLLKIFLYGVGSFIICTFMLFAKKWKVSRSHMLKAHVGFLVLMVTSVYSFFYDKAVKGKADVLGLISCGAFALMSFSLSRQIDLGFEVDLLNFFLGCLTVQLMKINLMLASVGAVFCYFLIVLRSSLDSQPQIGTVSVTDHVAVEIAAANGLDTGSDHGSNTGFQSEHSNNHQHQELPSLRKRKAAKKWTILSPTIDDNHAWRKYGQKDILNSKYPRSYYRCTRKHEQGCQATKQVQRTDENPDICQITYIGIHTCKDTRKAVHLVTDSGNQESFHMNSHPDSKVPNEQDHPISSSYSSSTIKQEYPKEDSPSDLIGSHTCKDTPKAPHLVTDSGTCESFLVNSHPDSKIPNEQDNPISSSNSCSTITISQEYPNEDTPSDIIDHKLDPSLRSDLKDFEVSKPAIMPLKMASDDADSVYSRTSSKSFNVNFGNDETSTQNSNNNEDSTCHSQL